MVRKTREVRISTETECYTLRIFSDRTYQLSVKQKAGPHRKGTSVSEGKLPMRTFPGRNRDVKETLAQILCAPKHLPDDFEAKAKTWKG